MNGLPVIVRDLLELELIREKAELIAGHSGLDRTVSFVTIMEAPDFHEWVDGGEFVLTTWYAFSQKPELQREAFLRLSEKIAAIAVKIDRFITEVPAEIVSLANEHGVPLFVLKREAKFREVIQSIAAEINNYQANLLMEVNRHYQETAKIAVAENDIRSFLSGLAKRGNCTCGFVNGSGELIGEVASHKTRAQSTDFGTQIQSFFQTDHHDIYSFRHNGELYFFPCVARQMLLGTLVIRSEQGLTEKMMMMANNLTTFLTLRQLEEIEGEQKNLSALVDDIFYRHHLTEDQVRRKMSKFGLRCKAYFQILVVQAATYENPESIRLMRLIASRIKNVFNNALCVIEPDEVMIIISSGSREEAAVKSALKKSSGLHGELLGDSILIGVGPPVKNIDQMEICYRIARQTIRAGRRMSRQGVFFASDDLISNVAINCAHSEEGQLLWMNVLEPLTGLDKSAGSALLMTLECAVVEENLEAVARKLGVHENTVRYRLKRIAELTGYDFFTPSGRVVLTLASNIMRYKQETPPE